MTQSEWTTHITKVLRNKAKREHYDCSNFEETLEVDGLRIRPDVIWSKNGKRCVIFEIDTGAGDTSQKSIYGSILSGIVLAKRYRCIFIEITPKCQAGEKAEFISKIIKKIFRDSLPTFYTLQISRLSGKCVYENIQKSITTELKNLGIIN